MKLISIDSGGRNIEYNNTTHAAELTGISEVVIQMCIDGDCMFAGGRKWRWQKEEKDLTDSTRRNRKFKEERDNAMIEDLNNGMTRKEIAEKYSIKYAAVSQALRKKLTK